MFAFSHSVMEQMFLSNGQSHFCELDRKNNFWILILDWFCEKAVVSEEEKYFSIQAVKFSPFFVICKIARHFNRLLFLWS